MMIAAGGEILKIHMHADLFCMEPSLLSCVCAESSTLGKEAVCRKGEVISVLQKHTGLLCGHAADFYGRNTQIILLGP